MRGVLVAACAAVVCLAGQAQAEDTGEVSVPLQWKAEKGPMGGHVADVPNATVRYGSKRGSVFVQVEYLDGTKCLNIDNEFAYVTCGRHRSAYTLGCGYENGQLRCFLTWSSHDGRPVGEK